MTLANAADITAKLLEPFPIDVIDEKNGLSYIPHEIIRDRLISATDNNFDWSIDQVLFRDDGVTKRANDRYTGEPRRPISMIVIGTLTIPGLGSRAGIGAHPLDEGAGEDAAYKSAESDALKRAAMGFGVGLHQLYIETGEAKRASKQGRNRGAQTAPAARNQGTRSGDTTRTPNAPQNRSGERPAASKPETPEPSVPDDPKVYAAAVATALAEKNGLEFNRLVDAADQMIGRWIALVQAAESPQALDWIKRQIERKVGEGKMTMTDVLTEAIREREAKINGGDLASPIPPPINTPEAVAAEYDLAAFRVEVGKAVAVDDAKRFAELGSAAGTDAHKWHVLIEAAQKDTALDWIGRQLDAKRMHTADMKARIAAARELLTPVAAG